MIDEEKASTESLNVKGKHIDCLMDYDKELSGGISVVINLFIIVEKTMSYHLAHNHLTQFICVIPVLVLLQLFDVFCIWKDAIMSMSFRIIYYFIILTLIYFTYLWSFFELLPIA